MTLPAVKAAPAGSKAARPSAMRSAFTNCVTPSVSLRRGGPVVDFPAPLGPARATTSGDDTIRGSCRERRSLVGGLGAIRHRSSPPATSICVQWILTGRLTPRRTARGLGGRVLTRALGEDGCRRGRSAGSLRVQASGACPGWASDSAPSRRSVRLAAYGIGGRMAAKYIYAFGGGTADGRGDQKELLGGKGAGLAEMSRLGIPVPPGCTLTTEVCTWFQEHHGSYPPGLEGELDRQLRRLEALTGQRFGDVASPLLVSVRSGAPMSMPGMMDTVLNLGLSQALVDAWIARGADARFVLDAWRRLLTMYGDVVLGVEHAAFEEILAAARAEHGAASDNELPPAALAAVAEKFRRLIAEHGQPFPEEPRAQLWGAIGAVFSSWNKRRAREYRRIKGISDRLGTAVNVQAMVFGNRGNDCATGVAFTRNPATGEARVYGEYLVNAQGEDVVAGIRTPLPIVGLDGGRGLAEDFPQADRELCEVCTRLERHYRDMQDVEFTIQHDRLYMLQTRRGARTRPAAVRIAAELVDQGIITPREAGSRVKPDDLVQVLAPEFDVQEKARAVADGRLLARGLPAGPGAASGRMVLSADRAAELAAQGPVILVRAETSPA